MVFAVGIRLRTGTVAGRRRCSVSSAAWLAHTQRAAMSCGVCYVSGCICAVLTVLYVMAGLVQCMIGCPCPSSCCLQLLGQMVQCSCKLQDKQLWWTCAMACHGLVVQALCEANWVWGSVAVCACWRSLVSQCA